MLLFESVKSYEERGLWIFFFLVTGCVGKTHYVSSCERDGRQNGLRGKPYGSSLLSFLLFSLFINTNCYRRNVAIISAG